MKYSLKIFSLLIGISLIAGCIKTPPTVRITEQVEPTASSTATFSPTPRRTSTISLPTVTPTVTSTPTPPSLPTLKSITNSTNYQLGKPSEEGLLTLIDSISIQHNYYNSNYNIQDSQESNFRLDETSSLRDVVDKEIEYYYPDGFSHPEIAMDFYPPKEKRWFPFYSPVYLELLSDAILVDLQHNHPNLVNEEVIRRRGYEAKVQQIELDHDDSPEWLIRIDWTEIDSLSWLTLDQKSDHSFSKLDTSLPNITWWPSEDQIQALQDFTGDGLTDVIFLDYGYVWGTDFGTFYVNQGTRNGFQPLDEISISIPGYLSEGLPFTLETPSGSRWLSLSVSDPHAINWGCTWETVTTYRWPFGSKQTSIKNKEAPSTADCDLARAVLLYDSPNPQTAVRLLENAIPRFSKEDPDLRAKLLFAHYRLAILYSILGKESPSRQHIDWLVQNLNEGETYFKSGLQSLLKGTTINPIHLCDVMYSAADVDIPKGWEKFVNATAAINAYPYSPETYPPAICPLREILSDKLNKVDWKEEPLSEEAFTGQGIPVISIETYPFPDQEHPASFILLGAKTLYVLGYVPTQEGWQWRLLETFDSTGGLPGSFYQDVTGDEIPELAYYQQSQDIWGCPENEQGYQIFLTTSSGFGLLSTSNSVCHPVNQPFDITEHLTDRDQDGVIDWVAEQIQEYAGESFLSAERVDPVTWFTAYEIGTMISSENDEEGDKEDLISELYEENRPSEIREKLMAERDGIESSDPFFDRKWQNFTYLIAISYEMEGQPEKAAEMFSSILASETHTLWENLAELHLTVK